MLVLLSVLMSRGFVSSAASRRTGESGQVDQIERQQSSGKLKRFVSLAAAPVGNYR
jgi:hypothetical protein